MIKCECIINSLKYNKFDKLRNIKRINPYKNELGKLYKGDMFECDESIAKYLFGDNDLKKRVIDIVEIIPNKKDL